MRIAIVSEPGRDGVFDYVRRLVHFIHESHPECHVDLFFSSRRGCDGLWSLVQEVSAHGGRAEDLKIGNGPHPRDFIALVKLANRIVRGGYDVVHAHSSKAGALVRMLATLPGAPPVLYNPHAYYGMSCRGGSKERFFNLVESILGRVGTTINCSEDERTFGIEWLGLDPNDLRLVHNGVDTRRYAPCSDEERRRHRAALGIPENEKLLVTIGRESYQKNYRPLYDALDVLLPTGSFRFAHAGEGSVELRASLSETARSQAHAYGHLSDTAPLLQAADAFILTSRYEGLSLSMLHALSCGLPLFLTKAPGFTNLAALGFQSITWLPDPARETSIVPGIIECLGSWNDASAAEREAQRSLAVELFDEGRQYEKIVQLYLMAARGELVGRNRSSSSGGSGKK